MPWDDGVHINENPPDEQEGVVEHADAFIPLAFPEMWKHGKRGDHRHQMQEQNDIAQEGIGHLLTLDHLKINPRHSIVSEPEEHAHAHEYPKEPDMEGGAARALGIEQESGGGNQQERTLDEVVGSGEGVASWHQHRRRRLGEDQRDQYRDPEFSRYCQGKLLRPLF